MRAIINHGRRGRTLPPKDYGCTDWTTLMVESYANGHHEQAISYFNRMKRFEQIHFLRYADSWGKYGDECRDLIIQNL
jgi:hypothetical protein